jgi:hypothetical protein
LPFIFWWSAPGAIAFALCFDWIKVAFLPIAAYGPLPLPDPT